MDSWVDRRIFWVSALTALAVYLGYIVHGMPQKSVWQLVGMASAFFLPARYVWVVHLRTRVKVTPEVLVAVNRNGEYVIPWSRIEGFQSLPGRLNMQFRDGSALRLDAFSEWPSFGRRAVVAGRLESFRREVARNDSAQVAATPNPPLVKLSAWAPWVLLVIAVVMRWFSY